MIQEDKLEEAKRLYETANADQKHILERLFPELKESEDEKTRKEMIFYFQEEIPQCSIQEHADKMKEFIARLEKKGEQKPTDKCDGCNNAKGCVACVDGSEWAHIEEQNPAWSERDDSNLERGSQYDLAKHFFELGLKAQHDNWKVVDNTNPPQADRNKIYCVFTKGRYILAKVICDPQDDDLLQWKCTEFPFHCYDMCEGDKYMQIV